MKKSIYHLLLRILRFFTRVYLWRTHPIVIGVTGSVGKTSCREIIAQVLSSETLLPVAKLRVYTSPKNYNSELGLIFSIFQIEDYTPSVKSLLLLSIKIIKKALFGRKHYDILVAEYGIDSPGDMDFLLSVLRPDYGILSKLDQVHSANFPEGVRQYWNDKCKLLIASKQGVYVNGNEPHALEAMELYRNPQKIFIVHGKSSLSFDGKDVWQTGRFEGKEIRINLIGSESMEYTLLALDIAKKLGVSLSEKRYEFRFHLQGGRFSLYQKGAHILIDSTYNASPESMKLAIQNTQILQKSAFPDSKLLLVLGDMRELGASSQQAHESLLEYVQEAEALFTVGPQMYSFLIPALQVSGFRGEIHSSLSSREIGKKLKKYLKDHAATSYIILFKGSQNTIFTEEALAPFLTPTEQKNLPRQSEDWKQKKDEFFRSL